MPAGRALVSAVTKPVRTSAVSLVVHLLLFSVFVNLAFRRSVDAPQMDIDDVYRAAVAGRIHSARLLEEDSSIVGRLCASRSAAAEEPPSIRTPPGGLPAGRVTPDCTPGRRFSSFYPRSDVLGQQLFDTMASRGTEVFVDKQASKAVLKLVVTFLFPLLILANLFAIIFVASKRLSEEEALARRIRFWWAWPAIGLLFAALGAQAYRDAATEYGWAIYGILAAGYLLQGGRLLWKKRRGSPEELSSA